MNEGHGGRRCPQCGLENSPSAAFCAGCGRPFAPAPAPDDGRDELRSRPIDPEVFHPDAPMGLEQFDGVPAADVTRLVGKNTGYYLPVFEKLRHSKGMGRFHFPALIFGGGWMLYRKQYTAGAIAATVQLALWFASSAFARLYTLPALADVYARAGISAAQSSVTEEQTAAVIRLLGQLPAAEKLLCLTPLLFLLLELCCSLVIAAHANRWYYRHVLHMAAEAGRDPLMAPELRQQRLQRRGGVNLPLAICLAVCYVIFRNFSGILLAALFP